MVSERGIRLSITPLALLSFLASVITLAIAASLEAHWLDVGFPSGSVRDRERVLLTAGIVGTVVSLYSLIGTFFFADRLAFGIFFHLIAFTVTFLLFLIGSSSLVAITDKIDCGNVEWSRCNITKGLVAIGWIETIFAFALLIIVLVLGIKSRSGVGMRKGALTDA
ncbi:hypothetical protein JCM6882_007918 [Rhodosporidiobolus microsporus]